jgi:hypothetical protein
MQIGVILSNNIRIHIEYYAMIFYIFLNTKYKKFQNSFVFYHLPLNKA